VKLKVWAPLVCLAVCSLFAGSALAQEDATAPDQNLQNRLRNQLAAGKPFNGDASSAAKTQEPKSDAVVSPDATTTCAHTFTSGSGVTYLQFCVTVNGNIVEFQSPAGVEQIRQGTFGEGYGICDFNRGTMGSGGLAYYDFAGDGASTNWDAPILVTHTATMVKIERTTSDGVWTLTQTINSVAGTNPYAKVAMALKNNATPIAGDAEGVYLMRWADSDPDNAESDGFSQNLDGTMDSAWGYIPTNSSSGNDPYGLMIQSVGNSTPASVSVIRDGFALNTSDSPDPCNPTANYASPITNTDGAILYLYLFVVKKGQTVTVTSRYMSF
jgi:hypothetical protein